MFLKSDVKNNGIVAFLSRPEIIFFMMVSMTAFIFLVADPVFAQEDLGSLADRLKDQTNNVYGLAKNVAILVGFVLVIMGFVKLNSSRQQQQGVGGAVALIAVGFLLVSIGAVVSMGSGTFFEGGVENPDSIFE